MKTIKNKLVALGLIVCGVLATAIDGDATVLIIISMFAIPLLFARRNWVY